MELLSMSNDLSFHQDVTFKGNHAPLPPPPPPPPQKKKLCITAIGNILASGNLCVRVFKLQLKVIKKVLVICTVYE